MRLLQHLPLISLAGMIALGAKAARVTGPDGKQVPAQVESSAVYDAEPHR